MSANRTRNSRPSLGGFVLQHLIVFLICVVFPGLVTWVAPASWLNFVRDGERVRLTARTCMFFVVPFKVQRVDEVVGISSRERAGGTRRKREYGREKNQTVHEDGEGFLQIVGADGQQAEVSVSPASLERVVSTSQDFLNSNQATNLTLFAVANWKFGGLMGGVLTSFTALWVVGYSLGLVNWLFRAIGALVVPRQPESYGK